MPLDKKNFEGVLQSYSEAPNFSLMCQLREILKNLPDLEASNSDK